PQELSSSNKALPLTKISSDAGSYVHWSKDSKKLMWTLGPKYFSRELKNSFSFVEGSPAKLPASENNDIDIGLNLQVDVPAGKIALTGGQIISMKGNEVIEKGTIVIDKNKLLAVGPAKYVQLPDDALVIHTENKTLIPGFV